MEKYIGEINSRGESLYSSAATRLKQLPRAGIFEDLGSSFKPSQSKMLEKNQDTAGKKRTPSVHYSDSDFGSEDEMDCLSQNTEADEKTVLDKVKPTSGSRQLSSYHPDVLNGRSKTLKGLKFNKKKSMNVGVDVDVNVEEPLPSQDKPRAKAKESRRRDGTDIESADDEGSYKNTRKLKNTLSTSTLASTSNDAPTTARPKVRPRPITRPPPPSAGEDVDSLFGTSTKKTGTRTLSSIPPPSLSSSNKDSKCASPPYNADLSSGSLGSTSTTSSSSHPPPPSSSFTSTILSSGSGPRLPQKFPTFSPLNSPATKRSIAVAAKSFPDLSPLSKDKDKDTRVSKGKGRGKGKRKAVTRDLQPFPMSTQDLDGISALEEDDDSDVDVRHARKRRYQGDNEPFSMDQMDLYEEEDSLFMSPAIDPKTLCPYCDAPLPSAPTPHLLRLLRQTLEKSHPDPRSSNPLGRRAPLSTFVPVCQRHKFENEILPEAEEKGWPKMIDWERLGARVARMKGDLKEIIGDSGEDDYVAEGDEEEMMTSLSSKGPRMKCVFWREAMKAVKLRGARAVAGVRAQFLDFEKSQPGYYGELGSMIIHQTLLNMFPLDSFDPTTITPFTTNEFIQRILVPEVALRLIMEDRRLKGFVSAEEALQVLRDSTAYGVVMFPEDSEEGARKNDKFGVGVGDRIVMERARKRRKEIEIEEGGEIEQIEIEAETVIEDAPPVRGTESNVGSEGSRTARRQPVVGSGQRHKISEAINSDSVDERVHLPFPRKPTRKRRPAADDDVISIDSKSDGNDTEASVKTDGDLARSRPRRNTKIVSYTDVSSDSDNEKSKRSKLPRYYQRSLSKPRSTAPARSLSPGKWTVARTRPKARTDTEAKPRLQPFPMDMDMDTDICFMDENTGKKKKQARREGEGGKKSPLASPRKGSSQRSLEDKHRGGDKVVDLDLNTPIPRRRVYRDWDAEDVDIDPTPRPMRKAEGSTLAKARVRNPKNGGATSTNPKPKSTGQNPSTEEWLFTMRASVPEDSTSDSGGDSSRRITRPSKNNKRKGKERAGTRTGNEEDYGWLLDDPSSQEKIPRKGGRSGR